MENFAMDRHRAMSAYASEVSVEITERNVTFSKFGN
jgi:hypothetical protein